MYKSYRKCSVIITLLFSSACFGLTVPSSPTNSVGNDEVRARDGSSCRQGTHQGPTFDTGVSGGITNNDLASIGQNINNQANQGYSANNNSQANNIANDVGLYARVIIPLGNDVPRIDCSRLYELEIQRMELEIEKLKKSGQTNVVVE